MANGKKNKILKKHQDELDSVEQTKWESGNYYGENPESMNDTDGAAWDAAKAKVNPTSIRLPLQLMTELRRCAEEEGLGLHSYIRMVLTRAVRKRDSA